MCQMVPTMPGPESGFESWMISCIISNLCYYHHNHMNKDRNIFTFGARRQLFCTKKRDHLLNSQTQYLLHARLRTSASCILRTFGTSQRVKSHNFIGKKGGVLSTIVCEFAGERRSWVCVCPLGIPLPAHVLIERISVHRFRRRFALDLRKIACLRVT